MEPINFAEVQKEIPERTEFVAAIMNSNTQDELVQNITDTQIFQESGLEIGDIFMSIAMLYKSTSYEPRQITLDGSYGSQTRDITQLSEDLIVYLTDKKGNIVEQKIEIDFLTFPIDDSSVKEKATIFFNRLVDETELFVRDLKYKEWFGINPYIKNKLHKIFYG